MSTTAGPAAPTLPRSRRLVGVDAARGLALLGMMVAHLVDRQDPLGGESLGFALVDGRASATFALLAGVGLALADGGHAGPRTPLGRTVARTAVRALCILLLGLFLADLGPPVAVILQYYAVSFLLLAPLLRLPAPLLGAGGLLWLAAAPFASQALRAAGELTGPGPQVGLVALVTSPPDALVTLLLTGYYPVLTWFGYLLVGAAVGRLDLTRTAVVATLAAAGAVLASGASLVSALLLTPAALTELAAQAAGTGRSLTGPLYGTTPPTSWLWLALDTPHSGTPPDLLGTTGAALLVLGGCLLLARTPLVVPLRLLAAAGSMTLTLYTAHVLAVLLGLPGFSDWTSWAVHAVLALVVAGAVRAVWDRGPLEALVAAVVDTVAGPGTPRRPVAPVTDPA